MENESLVERLRKRAEIRRQISTRKSVQEGKPDRIADLLEEAAAEITKLSAQNDEYLETVAGVARDRHMHGDLDLHRQTKYSFGNCEHISCLAILSWLFKRGVNAWGKKLK